MYIAFIAAIMISGGQTQPSANSASPSASSEINSERRAENRTSDDRGDRQVCRRERFVGSNRTQRVCMTQREWEQMRDLSREQHRNATREQPVELPKMGG